MTSITGRDAVARLMRPKTAAVIGASSRAGSAGYNAFTALRSANCLSAVYGVSRSGGTIEGHACLASIADLPEGVDLAVFTLPKNAVREALGECAKRHVKAAVIFAAGFSEVGGTGQSEQQALSAAAEAGGIALLGPNCLGFRNFVDGLSVSFFPGMGGGRALYQGTNGVAILGQSGLLVAHIQSVLEARKLSCSHFVTTGNEAGLGIADFLDYFASDNSTRAIAVFAEQIRRPQAFLAAAKAARAAGKQVVMLHTGKSERAKATAQSHTGALAGDYAAMRTAIEAAGVLMVDTLEEIVDATDLLMRFPTPPTKGVGIISFSGAFCGQSHDYCAEIGLDIPQMSPHIAEALRPQVPEFAPPANPLDLTTQPAWQPELLGIGAKALLDDPAIGSVVIATPIGLNYLDGLLPRLEGNTKPILWGAMSDGLAQPEEFTKRIESAGLPLIVSPERAFRAVAKLTQYGKRLARAHAPTTAPKFTGLPKLGTGPQAEWVGKQLLSAIGIKTPRGALARDLEEAKAAAARIGYPVALKAQAAALSHKTEAGGVMLGISNEAALTHDWQALNESIRRAAPGIALDGILIEQMAPKGLELMIGARRDPDWGPILLIGLGGIWVEAIGDVRLLPPDLDASAIEDEFCALKSAKLLRAFRGTPALDVKAAADAAARLGRLMLSEPAIKEIDVNPLVIYPQGQGAMALDALVVTG
ncbi:MAG: acetate--CoA ligase family protein [Alphaproteobacteria bacterium]